MQDIVIDTNIFVHANSPQAQEGRQDFSINLLINLQLSNELLCVDEGFDFDESMNRSLIFQEYLKHLNQGDLGLVVLLDLLTSGRIKEVKRNTSKEISRQINKINVKPRDKTFVRVAANSINKVLTSHDFDDFHEENRLKYKSYANVSILTAQETLNNYY